MNCRLNSTVVCVALNALLAAGCANLPQAPNALQMANLLTVGPAVMARPGNDQCEGLNALSDGEAAAKLDIAELMLQQLRARANLNNEAACRLPPEARNKIMAAYRNSVRNPDRKTFRAPAK